VRAALKTRPYRYDSIEAALQHVDKVMDIPRKTWISNSGILTDWFTQRRLDDYV